jgi:type III pantothenate kinase
MLLVIDIGNTNAVLGVYQGSTLAYHWRLATDSRRSSDEYRTLIYQLFQINNIKIEAIEHIVIASVVPPIVPIFQRVIFKLFKKQPTFIDPTEDYGMPVKLDNPKELGADRIVNAIAAYEKFKEPLIIVDFGTATTFDVVSGEGEYVGGIIAPGIILSLEALCSNASRLPRVEIEAPKQYIGKNTVESMQSGILFGYAGMVDSLVEKLSTEIEGKPRVIATGGLAKLVSSVATKIELVLDDLTLLGLYIIYHKFIKTAHFI